MFKTGHAWDLYQFMVTLDKPEQKTFAIGRLKQLSREEASRWNEVLSESEASLCQKFEAFCRVRDQFQVFNQLQSDGKMSDANIAFDITCAPGARILCDTDSNDPEHLVAKLSASFGSIPASFEEQVKARRAAGEKITLVSKKKLQKVITQRFKDAFAGQYVECAIDEGHWTTFCVRCGSWMLTTQFTFGRQQSQLSHWHSICSKEKILHPTIPSILYPAVTLLRGACWPCSSQWECIVEHDVALACDETLKYCRYFYEAAPKLLKGLEFEKIETN